MVFPKLRRQQVRSKKDHDIVRGAEILQREISQSLLKKSESPNEKTVETWDVSRFDEDDESFDALNAYNYSPQKKTEEPFASASDDHHSVYSFPAVDLEEVPPPPARTDAEDTPITHMGRDGKMRTKMVTYVVRNNDDYDTEDDSDVQTVEDNIVGVHPQTPHVSSKSSLLKGMEELDRLCNPCPGYLPSKYDSPRVVTRFDPEDEERQEAPAPTIKRILKATDFESDAGYVHAQRAGHLWQSLVGQHVKFPTEWFNGERGPALGHSSNSKWQYYGRVRVPSNSILKAEIKNRSSPGRLLLHIIVVDDAQQPVLDIVAGAYHPNARGIRETESPNHFNDGYREIWWATRRRSTNGAATCVLEDSLGQDRTTKGPLGDRRRVSNTNVRPVFGESPPLETIFLPERELEFRLSSAGPVKVMSLLNDYCFT